MKKILQKIIIPIMGLSLMVSLDAQSVKANQEKEITVTTTFIADIVKQISDDQLEVNLIVPAGGDPHLYTASANDLEKISQADLVLYHGLHFEAQIAEVLESLEHAHAITTNFSEADLIFVAENSEEIDPHYWFDHDLYRQSVVTTSERLIESFPDYQELVETNTKEYLAELDELEIFIATEIEKLKPEQRILVTPHDAFTYFAKEHGFTVYAPQGISTESEASNEAIMTTVNYIVDHQIPAIFLDTTSNPRAMEKLKEGVEEKGGQVRIIGGEGNELFSDSLAAPGKPADTYLEMYQHNVELIVNNLVK